MNGDTIDRIARFLERDVEKMPERVSNSMILIVWAFSAVVLAFLGGLGMYLFGWMVR
jgi:hypothetical protein